MTQLFPYQSRTEHAKNAIVRNGDTGRNTVLANVVFFSPIEKAENVPCPWCDDHETGNCVSVGVVRLILPCDDGRIQSAGSLTIEKGKLVSTKDAVRYDFASEVKLPVAKRSPVGKRAPYTTTPVACTHYDDLVAVGYEPTVYPVMPKPTPAKSSDNK